jgi:hypothetical protein
MLTNPANTVYLPAGRSQKCYPYIFTPKDNQSALLKQPNNKSLKNEKSKIITICCGLRSMATGYMIAGFWVVLLKRDGDNEWLWR